MQLYKITRHYAPHLDRCSEDVKKNLTLEEAQEHCRSDDTHEPGVWFDGYIEQEDDEIDQS